MEKKSGKKPETPANGRRNFLKGASGAVIGGALTAGAALLPQQKAQAHSVAWEQPGNNNHIIDLQESSSATSDTAKLEYYGHCAFKLTSPAGVTMMFDPWRNDPSGAWGALVSQRISQNSRRHWHFTHAHFDHDALERVDATMLLDRMVGEYQFSDVKSSVLPTNMPAWHPVGISGQMY